MICRWFGEKDDSIPLEYFKQIPGLVGVATSLMDIPVGEVWSMDRLRALHRQVQGAGLELEVIESVNIHEDIKLGLPSRDRYIEAYIETMKHLSAIGVKVICYNFMPVLDWARSDLYYTLPDGSKTMFYDNRYITGTTPEALAERYAQQAGGIAMPGWEPERMAAIRDTIQQYVGMGQEEYWEHIRYFIQAIIPWAERLDIRMAIHPDDPPQSIFGLPRLIGSAENIRRFLALSDSPFHGLTLCTGSLGANPSNDIPAMIQEFAPRIHFAHLRNIRFIREGEFYESAHPTACGSLDMYAIVKAFYDTGFQGYVRPDHGRQIWGETGRPGYGLYDRALGVTYLLGLWEALSRQ